MAVEDDSSMAEGSLTYGSMAATNTVSKIVAYQPPGSPSESVLGTDVKPEMPPVPPQVLDGDIAGTGRKGGELHGTGANPGEGFSWTQANSAADGDGDSKWTTSRQPFNWTDI